MKLVVFMLSAAAVMAGVVLWAPTALASVLVALATLAIVGTSRRILAADPVRSAADARFRAYFEHAPVAIFVADSGGRYREANPAAVAMLGHSLEALRELDLASVAVAEPAGVWRRFQAILPGQTLDLDGMLRRKDGVVLWVRLHAVGLPSGDVVAFCEDIRARRAAAALARIPDAVEALGPEPAPTELLGVLVEEAGRLSRSRIAVAFELGEDGRPSARARSSRTPSGPLDLEPACGEAIRAARAQIHNDLHREAGALKIDHCLVVPIRVGGRVAGVLALANGPGRYDAEELAWTEELVDYVAAVWAKIDADRSRAADQQQFDLAIRESEERFRRLVSSIDEVFVVATLEPPLVHYLSPPATRILGWAPPSLPIGLDVAAAALGLDRARTHEVLEELAGGERQRFEVRLRPEAGPARWVEARVYRVDGYLHAVIADISARKAAEAVAARQAAALERMAAASSQGLVVAEARTSAILDAAADGLIGVGPDGVIGFANPAARALSGWPELVGRTLVETLLVDRNCGSPPCRLCQAISEGVAYATEGETFARGDGSLFPVEYGFRPFAEGGGVVSFRDISARKATEEARLAALEEARAHAATRTNFLSHMSHELRTPLNTIVGTAQNILRATGDPRPQVLGILDAGRHLQGVVNAVLDQASVEAGKFPINVNPFDLGELVDRVVALVATHARQRRQAFRVTEAADLPFGGEADGQRIAQVLVNLLANAIKFTPERGVVSLDVSRDGAVLVCRVSDNGPGIGREEIRKIFLPFETRGGAEDTGLGLGITRELVERMGGALDVQSELGRGSVFTVRIPAGLGPAADLPPVERVAAMGLDERELGALEQALGGVGLVPVAEAALLVVHGALVDAPVVSRALERGARVLVLVQPGEAQPEGLYQRGIGVVYWPLRLRALRRKVLSISETGRICPRLPGLAVAIADDNPVAAQVLSLMLRLEGAEVSSYRSGEELVEAVGARPEAFRIVLTDVHMGGIDGFEVARRLRLLRPELPVVGVTAEAMPGDRERCIEAGMRDHLAKPVDADALVDLVLRHTSGAEIDWDALRRAFSRPGAVGRLATTTVSSARAMEAEIRAAQAVGNDEALAAAAHQARGMLATVRATRAAALAGQLEAAIKEGRPVVALVGGLLDALAAVGAEAAGVAAREPS